MLGRIGEGTVTWFHKNKSHIFISIYQIFITGKVAFLFAILNCVSIMITNGLYSYMSIGKVLVMILLLTVFKTTGSPSVCTPISHWRKCSCFHSYFVISKINQLSFTQKGHVGTTIGHRNVIFPVLAMNIEGQYSHSKLSTHSLPPSSFHFFLPPKKFSNFRTTIWLRSGLH